MTIGGRGCEERFVVVVFAEHRLELELGFLARLDEEHLGTERLGDELDHLVGEGLRAGDHLAGVEQQPHEVGGGAVQQRGVLLDRDPARDDDLALGDRGVLRSEVGGRRRTEVLEVATTPLLAPGPLTLGAGTTAATGATPSTTGATTRTATGTATGTATRAAAAGRGRTTATSRERRAAATTTRVGREDTRAAAATRTAGRTAARRAGAGSACPSGSATVPAGAGSPCPAGLRSGAGLRPARPPPVREPPRQARGAGAGAGAGGAGAATADAAAAAGRTGARSGSGMPPVERTTRCGRGRTLGERLGLGDAAGGAHHAMRRGRGRRRRLRLLDRGRLGLGDVGDRGGGRLGGADRRSLLGRLLLGRLLLDLGLVDDGIASDALRVGESADAVRHRVLDARGVALDPDLELGGQLEGFLVAEAQLTGEFVDPDLLRQGRSARLSQGQSRRRRPP